MKDDERPPGQHMEREARYAVGGFSPVERDELIWKLHNQGWTQQRISRTVGMTQAGISHALKRLQGIQRKRSAYRLCQGWCCETFPKQQLNADGLCKDCAADG